MRWSRLGDAVYYVALRDDAGVSDPAYLYRRGVSGGAAGAPSELGALEGWSTFDVAHEGDKVFWSAGNGTFKLLDLAVAGAGTAGAQVLACPRGMRMAYSPGDSRIAYASETAKGGHYLMVQPSNCDDPRALTGKGSWGWIDWRP